MKSGGWHWGDSRLRQPDHVARLLVLAYVWMIALGSQAVAASRATPLLHRPDGSFRRLASLFKEGLTFFVEVVQRQTDCRTLLFFPGHRFP